MALVQGLSQQLNYIIEYYNGDSFAFVLFPFSHKTFWSLDKVIIPCGFLLVETLFLPKVDIFISSRVNISSLSGADKSL